MLRTSLLLLLFAAPAAAQPSAEALVASWLRAQRAAEREVVLSETLERRLEGPRQSLRIETEGSVRYAPGDRPRRTVRRGTVDGEALTAREIDGLDRRLAYAFGPGGRELGRPPPPPHDVLARAEARSVAADRLDGQRAWRVALRLDPPPEPGGGRRGRRPPPPDALTAWFSRDGARLLELRLEGRRRGGLVTRTLRFQRTRGLDVPASASARAELRQRRRLRSYAVEVTSEATYRVTE